MKNLKSYYKIVKGNSMSNVNVSVATVNQVFAPGTIEDAVIVYSIVDSAGNVVATQSSAELSVSFTGILTGDYNATASKNGVTAGVTFSVPSEDVNIQVPSVVTVVLN